jgi:AraC-like DNA-binding protein
MSDFASAAMMRLIRDGLIAQKLPTIGSGNQPKLASGAHTPLVSKRAALQAIFDAHGPLSLLKIGQAINTAHDEPALRALTLASEPMDLVHRWQKLEKFVHSKHRTQVLAEAADRVTLKHIAIGPEQPSYAENLLIFGLLCALIERIDGVRLKARCLPHRSYCRNDAQWVMASLEGADSASSHFAATWEIVWTKSALTKVSAEAPSITDLSEDYLLKARALVASDPSYRWSVDQLAAKLQLPLRTFQHYLAERGSSFSEVLKNERLVLSAVLLAQSMQSAAEIGYCCGFSDQAHFSREFKRYTAMTPLQYRESFST